MAGTVVLTVDTRMRIRPVCCPVGFVLTRSTLGDKSKNIGTSGKHDFCFLIWEQLSTQSIVQFSDNATHLGVHQKVLLYLPNLHILTNKAQFALIAMFRLSSFAKVLYIRVFSSLPFLFQSFRRNGCGDIPISIWEWRHWYFPRRSTGWFRMHWQLCINEWR